MQQSCRFCTWILNSLQDVIQHYNDVNIINKENSPTFESYIDVISKDPNQTIFEYCEYCSNPPSFDAKLKAEHYLRKHLKLLYVTRNNLLIRRVGNKFIEFSIDYTRHGRVYDFKDPDKVRNGFIENVARLVLSGENGKFRLVCCLVNQSAVELHGRRLYTNSCFTTGVIDGLMNNRVKELLFANTKKSVLINGENGSNIYFYRFDFLKIHFLASHLRNHIDIIHQY